MLSNTLFECEQNYYNKNNKNYFIINIIIIVIIIIVVVIFVIIINIIFNFIRKLKKKHRKSHQHGTHLADGIEHGGKLQPM